MYFLYSWSFMYKMAQLFLARHLPLLFFWSILEFLSFNFQFFFSRAYTQNKINEVALYWKNVGSVCYYYLVLCLFPGGAATSFSLLDKNGKSILFKIIQKNPTISLKSLSLSLFWTVAMVYNIVCNMFIVKFIF